MFRIRSIVYVLCISAAILLLLALAMQALPPAPASYTSVHPASTVPPMMGFAAESVFNTGDAKDLAAFPGIGEVLSQRIVEFRETWGNYRIPEDLLLVKGIGEVTLGKIMNVLEEPLVILQPREE